MTIVTGFFIALAVFVIGAIFAFVNMATMMRGKRTMESGIGLHMVAGIMTALGAAGAFVTGIIWIVTRFTA